MKHFLSSFNLLTEAEINELETLLRPVSLQKGEFFIQEGQVAREAAFVESGILRSFYHNSVEEEVTYCFTFANHFLSAYSSYLTEEETVENIQAMTDVQLLTVSREEILRLEETSTNWLKLSKMIAEQEYINMEKRIFLLQKESAEKRYEDLLRHDPALLQHIPLGYLASYLGITQRHLSRLRKSVSI